MVQSAIPVQNIFKRMPIALNAATICTQHQTEHSLMAQNSFCATNAIPSIFMYATAADTDEKYSLLLYKSSRYAKFVQKKLHENVKSAVKSFLPDKGEYVRPVTTQKHLKTKLLL